MKILASLFVLATMLMPRTFQASAEGKPEAKAETKVESKEVTHEKTQESKDPAVDPEKAHDSLAAVANGESHKADTKAPSKSTAHKNSGCLVSEEAIADLTAREKKIEEQSAALAAKEEELKAIEAAIQKQLADLDEMKKQIQGIKSQEIAKNQEKVKKLIDTFETMSPKAAAKVIAEIDESLAVEALSKITNVKAGKILSNLSADKASKLSEMIAFGTQKKGGENAESIKRSPASQR